MRRSQFLAIMAIGAAFVAAVPDFGAAQDSPAASESQEEPTSTADETPATVHATGDRWALLIGINDYANLSDLEYCAADMQALRERLIKAGFEEDHVLLLRDKSDESRHLPTVANINRQLDIVTLDMPEPGDFVLVAFSGHGMKIGKSSYLCPAEADPAEPSTLISVDSLYERLNRSPASFRLAIVDACRNDPNALGQRAGRATGGMQQFRSSLDDHPQGVLMLTSCGPGEIAWEETEKSRKFQGGVFTHFLLEGLDGGADEAGNRDGVVSLEEWVRFANRRTKTYVWDRFNTVQKPGWAGDAPIDSLEFPVGRLLARNEARPVVPVPAEPTPEPMPDAPVPEPAPVAARPPDAPADLGAIDDPPQIEPYPEGVEREISNSIGIKLKLIPAGEFTMGSSETEVGHGTDELQHRVRITKPFYLGMYEVTQEEYQHVMDTNPSYFSATGGGKAKVKGLNTARCPVERVSWEDAVEFCQRLSRQEGVTHRLPTEAEWEYACRAGTTTPFHFGSALNGHEANVGGNDPYGTSSKGPYLGRTTSVGRYNSNRFGLFDVTGNVWEWCSDWYDAEYYATSLAVDPTSPVGGQYRVLRGGAWLSASIDARATIRGRASTTDRYYFAGFRVAREYRPAESTSN